MTHVEAVGRNSKLLFWSKVFIEMKALAAVEVLFFEHRGVALDEVLYLSIVWSITALIAEVPSGYLADHIGRKRTLVLGVMFFAVSTLVQFWAHGFWEFALMFALMSLGFSCISGAETAILYDGLRQRGEESQMQEKSAKLFSARFVARGFVPVLGAVIARDLEEWQFRILIAINFAAFVVAIVLILAIAEPKVETSKEPVFAQSWKILSNDRWLFSAAMGRLLVFFAGFVSFRVYQPLFKINGATVLMIGGYYLLTRVAMFLLYWHVARAAKRFGTARVINWSAVIGAAFLVPCLFLQNVWLLMAFFAVGYVIMGTREPLYDKAFNDRIDSRSRATTLSMLNMLKCLLDFPFLLLSGWLVMVHINSAIIIAIAFALLALALFPARANEFGNAQP